MSKSHEPNDSAALAYIPPPIVQVHVNPMYIVVTQSPPGQTISVQIDVKHPDGTRSNLSIPNIPVGTTVVNTNAKTNSTAIDLIVAADKTGHS